MERVFQGPEKVSNLSLQGTGSGAMHSSSEGRDRSQVLCTVVVAWRKRRSGSGD